MLESMQTRITTADVIVIGAGVIGCSVAWHLAELGAGNVLVLEPSADGGAVKTGRKGTGTFEVIVRGRASHAGLEPEKGVNSLIEAAHQVLRIAEFGDAAAGTTVTPTVAKAGTADNVVPAETRIRVDVRVTSADEKDRILGGNVARMLGLAT